MLSDNTKKRVYIVGAAASVAVLVLTTSWAATRDTGSQRARVGAATTASPQTAESSPTDIMRKASPGFGEPDPQNIVWTRSTRFKANAILAADVGGVEDKDVWVIQAEGSFSPQRVPPGMETPAGKYLTLIADVNSGTVYDANVASERRPPLEDLGSVSK